MKKKKKAEETLKISNEKDIRNKFKDAFGRNKKKKTF